VATSILEQRFPGVPSSTTSEQSGLFDCERVDVIAGGFPCKGASTAGKREGSGIPRPFCGARWPEPLASFDPATSSWRTWRTSLLSTTEPSGERFSGTWPRSGTTSSGTAYQQQPSAPLTDVTGSSPLLPTPDSRNARNKTEQAAGSGEPAPYPGTTLSDVAFEWSGAPTGPPSDGGKRVHGPAPEPLVRGVDDRSTAGWSDPDCPLSATEFKSRSAGKTLQQLEWARLVNESTGRRVLALAPLAVGAQTVREAAKLDLHVTLARTADDMRAAAGVVITNYERLHHFAPEDFDGLVLDESSILKDYSGKTRQQIQAFADRVPFRLACTATPAPNDLTEVINHSEFVGALSGREVLAEFFVNGNDGVGAERFRLKRHGAEDFYAWLASWAVALRSPADLGYPVDGFELPALHMCPVVVERAGIVESDRLFAIEARSLQERQQARRESVAERVRAFAEVVDRERDEQWIAWCGLNVESEQLTAAIKDLGLSVAEVRGSDAPDFKEWALAAFATGDVQVLVTKPSIAGHGMNFQRCARMGFVGLSDSFEQLYQALRRCWRFGQQREVEAYVITAEAEGAVVENVERKSRGHERMMDAMVNAMGKLTFGRERELREPYEPKVPAEVPVWLRPREAVAA
jgi:hypothetical protein